VGEVVFVVQNTKSGKDVGSSERPYPCQGDHHLTEAHASIDEFTIGPHKVHNTIAAGGVIRRRKIRALPTVIPSATRRRRRIRATERMQ
jgi:hypothetical protein